MKASCLKFEGDSLDDIFIRVPNDKWDDLVMECSGQQLPPVYMLQHENSTKLVKL
jgi:hypothetical protein